MGNLSSILFISFAAPLLLAILICKNESRTLLFFFFIGTVVALFCGEFTGIFISISSLGNTVFTSNISPFIEELFKAIPILLYAFTENPKRQLLLECAALVGVGFAVLENAYVLAGNLGFVTIPLATIRGFGAGLMHGLCTMCVGYGASFIHTRKKVFYSGTIAILAAVSIYHAIYNMLVLSEHQLVGVLLPTVTFIPIWIFLNRKRRLNSGF